MDIANECCASAPPMLLAAFCYFNKCVLNIKDKIIFEIKFFA